MPEDWNALLNAHLDGRLSPAQRAKVLLHLKQPAAGRRYKRLESLRMELRASVPEPSPEQSARMWAAIRAQVPEQFAMGVEASTVAGIQSSLQTIPTTETMAVPTDPADFEPWYALFTRPWAPVWGLGLAGAAALVWVFLAQNPSALRQQAISPQAAPMAPALSAPSEVHASPRNLASISDHAEAKVHHRPETHLAQAQAQSKSLPSQAPSSAPSAGIAQEVAQALAAATPVKATGSTEVERALADNQMDDMIDQFLTVRQQSPGPVLGSQQALTVAPPDDGSMNGGTNVSYRQSDQVLSQDAPASSGLAGPAQGSKDGNGFWNWSPAAEAMNDHQWGQARVELQAASAQAAAPVERAFANSALGLLAAPGAPLQGTQPLLPAVGDLRVLSAGAWQLLVDSRLARFTRGVSVSLPGLRSDGDSFLLDLTFDRGEFPAGTHFTRVSGETPIRVIDAAKQPVLADDFYAPAGADYDIPDRELRLR